MQDMAEVCLYISFFCFNFNLAGTKTKLISRMTKKLVKSKRTPMEELKEQVDDFFSECIPPKKKRTP